MFHHPHANLICFPINFQLFPLLGVGLYCIGESNVFHQLSETTVNPSYIVGAQLVPISWGMHVAAWIQKQNKK